MLVQYADMILSFFLSTILRRDILFGYIHKVLNNLHDYVLSFYFGSCF